MNGTLRTIDLHGPGKAQRCGPQTTTKSGGPDDSPSPTKIEALEVGGGIDPPSYKPLLKWCRKTYPPRSWKERGWNVFGTNLSLIFWEVTYHYYMAFIFCYSLGYLLLTFCCLLQCFLWPPVPFSSLRMLTDQCLPSRFGDHLDFRTWRWWRVWRYCNDTKSKGWIRSAETTCRDVLMYWCTRYIFEENI